jgi:hypothetical protein
VVALEVWFDQRPDDALRPGDPAILVADLDGLDALIARVLDASAGYTVPAMFQASIVGTVGYPVLEAGIGARQGFIGYVDGSGAYFSAGDSTRAGEVTYDYMGHPRAVPASAEIPIDRVRQWLADFIVTERPSTTIPLRAAA